MYSEKNIFKMIFPLNCLFLGDAPARAIQVKISDTIIVDNCTTKYEDITVSDVKSLILSKKGISYSPDNLNLWKVDRDSVIKNIKLLGTFSTENDIKEKLGGELMEPLLSLDEYFNKDSFKDKKSKSAIHIIVQRLTTTTAVSNPFSDSNSILKWIQEYSPVTGRQPLTLLVETFGARFTLCGRDDTIETLWNGGGTEQRSGILNRFKNFKNFSPAHPKQDRNFHPIPFLACGPGTGKSRFLQELVNIIRNKASNSGDQDIMSILGNAVFLNVTYGNGTEASDFDVNIGAEASIALRILFSYFVHGNKSFVGFRDKIGQENARGLTLSLVLRAIYLSKLKEDKNIYELAIIVGIDEINKLYDKNYDKFRDLINSVGSASCNFIVDLISEEIGSSIPEKTGKVFFVPVFAGTVEGPLQLIITKSMHPPLQLPLHLLDIEDMLKIACNLGFDENFIYRNNLFRRMISDVGGQVRALEIFYDHISDASKTHGWDDIDLLDIMKSLEVELSIRYPFNKYVNMITPVLANAILDRPVDGDATLDENESISYKMLKSNGILSLEPVNTKFYIRIPYLWIRLLVKKAVNKSINKFWHEMIDPDEPFYWQNWETFNVKFWALRYCLFSALGFKQIELKELLKGAHYSDNLDLNANVDIPDYESVSTHFLVNQFPPSDANYNMLNTEGITLLTDGGKTFNISLKDNSKICKNGDGANGDGFCFLIINGKPMFLSFQMKWREQGSTKPSKIDDQLIKEEYEKSEEVAEKIGLGDNWLLLILSNRESTYTKDLPPNCAIVDRNNFNEFYGKTYSSRAQFFAAQNKVPINTARFCELRVIYRVGEKIAQAIIEDRDNNKRKYIDDDDLLNSLCEYIY
ncbi:hypothetical protein GLOIN_2v1668084 [Rhizophagus irregularis DAOM 181602=DAOM 197198]|nr:hypothetical protein GLOIN_2v1668084 [Rhizophagus irregularis DAOM 181602=DAOM 197198]